MKKLHITIVLLLAAFTAMAQPAALEVFSDGEPFQVSIDGKVINHKPKTSVTEYDITAEHIRVLVTLPNQNNLKIKQPIMVRPGKLMKVLVKQKNNGKWITRYQGEAPLPQKKATQEPVETETVTVDNTSTTQTGEQVSINTNMNSDGETGNVTATVTDPETGETVSVNANINDSDVNMTVTESSSSTTTTTTGGNMIGNTTVTINTSSTESNTTNTGEETTQTTTGCQPMGSTDFNSAKNSISSKTFEDSKITTAKQIIKANCLRADQIKQIMEVMDYEDSRLEIAKFAYQYCFDPNNYYKINDAFEYELTIDDLNEYIEAQ